MFDHIPLLAVPVRRLRPPASRASGTFALRGASWAVSADRPLEFWLLRHDLTRNNRRGSSFLGVDTLRSIAQVRDSCSVSASLLDQLTGERWHGNGSSQVRFVVVLSADVLRVLHTEAFSDTHVVRSCMTSHSKESSNSPHISHHHLEPSLRESDHTVPDLRMSFVPPKISTAVNHMQQAYQVERT